MKRLRIYQDERGVALVISLMFLTILALLGTTAVVLTTTDIQIGSHYKTGVQSFSDADAGIAFALGTMEAGLKAGTLPFTLPENDGDTTAQNLTSYFATPTGFSFSLSELTKIADNRWTFTSHGTDPNALNARTVLKVVFKRDAAISFAAFGDEKMEMHNSAQVYSYDSGTSSPATGLGDSTGQGDIGSNEWLMTKNSSVIDGDGVFGEYADGSPTTDDIWSTADFTGDAPVNAGRIDPDPLGINSGGEYDPISWSDPADNDNDMAVDNLGNDLSSNLLELGGGGKPTSITLYGKPGGANYYATNIDLKNGKIVTIDTTKSGPSAAVGTGGPVNLFLDSPLTPAFDMHNGSAFDVIPATAADKFAFFTNYTGKLDVKHSADFNGLFYAPLAEVVIHNCGGINGAVWGRQVDIKNSGVINYNTALADLYASKELEAVTWSDVRN